MIGVDAKDEKVAVEGWLEKRRQMRLNFVSNLLNGALKRLSLLKSLVMVLVRESICHYMKSSIS